MKMTKTRKHISLSGAWARGAKYPVVITRIIHSFLPNQELLFLEQRIRYLIQTKELVKTDDYCQGYNFRYFPVNLLSSKKMYGQDVELGCDLVASVINSKRIFNSVRCRFWMFEYPSPNMKIPVPFECRQSLVTGDWNEEQYAQYIAAVILKCNITIETKILDKIGEGRKFNIKDFPSLEKRCFPSTKCLRKNHLRTTRKEHWMQHFHNV